MAHNSSVRLPADAAIDDRATFAEAVGAEAVRMHRLAARLAPASNAEDIVQEALLRAWRHRTRFDPARGRFSTWLLTIVANEARRARRAGIRVLPAAHVEHAAVEDRLDVEAAVAQLPPRQRLAVDCFYFVDLTIADTAAVMQCSEGTVKSTLADARARLRAQLGDV